MNSTYEAPGPIKAFNAVPRFGHTSDILSLYEDNQMMPGRRSDYIKGIIFIASFCLAILVLWIIVLIIAKIIGKGVTSGRQLQQNTKQLPMRHRCWRILIVFCSLSIAISAIVFIVAGVGSTEQVFDEINDGYTDLLSVANDVVNITDKMIQKGRSTIPLRDALVIEVEDDICPLANGFSWITANYENGAKAIIEALTKFQDFSQNELIDLQNTFEIEFNSFSENFFGAFDTVEKYVQPYALSLTVFVFGFILTIGSLLAWQGPFIDRYFLIQKWVILPIFSLMVVLIGLVVVITGTGLVLNSDICLGGESKSPEGFVESLLAKYNLDEGTLEATRYYITNGCQGEYSRINDLDQLMIDLKDGLSAISDLRSSFEGNEDNIQDFCGVTQVRMERLSRTLDDSHDELSNIILLGKKVEEVLDCNSVNDVFVDISHSALCTSGPYALMWIFATMICVFTFGMIVILFRGLLYPSIVNHSDERMADEDTFTEIQASNAYDFKNIIGGAEDIIIVDEQEVITDDIEDIQDKYQETETQASNPDDFKNITDEADDNIIVNEQEVIADDVEDIRDKEMGDKYQVAEMQASNPDAFENITDGAEDNTFEQEATIDNVEDIRDKEMSEKYQMAEIQASNPYDFRHIIDGMDEEEDIRDKESDLVEMIIDDIKVIEHKDGKQEATI